MRGWQRERARHVRKRILERFLKKTRNRWKDGIKEVLVVQENQWRQIGLKTKALVKGKKSLHQLQVKPECVGSFLFYDDMMIAL